MLRNDKRVSSLEKHGLIYEYVTKQEARTSTTRFKNFNSFPLALKNKVWAFPGGPVAKTPHSCREPGFYP